MQSSYLGWVMGKDLDKSLLFIFMLIGALVVSMSNKNEIKNMSLTQLRDAMNHQPANVELKDEWELRHMQMEALKAEDERNYVGFHD